MLEEQERLEELGLFIKVQEETYVEYLAKVKIARDELHKPYKNLEEKYEQKCHALMVEEAKVQFDNASVESHRRELEKEISTLKYKHGVHDTNYDTIAKLSHRKMKMISISNLGSNYVNCANHNVTKVAKLEKCNPKSDGQSNIT